jgi:hypothetical protein
MKAALVSFTHPGSACVLGEESSLRAELGKDQPLRFSPALNRFLNSALRLDMNLCAKTAKLGPNRFIPSE